MGGVAECFGDAKMVIPADTYPQLIYQNYLLMLSMQGFKSLAATLKIWKEETDDKLFGREREFVSLPTTGKW